MNERELFVSANRIQDEKERESFLDAECGEDTGLKRRILELVDAAKAQDSFLSLPETRISDQKDYDDMGGQIGEYKILEKIGEGGFGIVYLAEQLEPIRRRVAIKVIKPGMDSRQVIARFEAERQALAIMDHPNIAKVLDAGTTEHTNRPYFVMELVKGYPITQFCDDKRLGSRQRLELFVLVCQAIQHAHIKGVIHRDIKPSNVLVAMYDGRPVPKVIDFGIAKAMGQPLTERTLNTGFGAVIGSIEYMSPEQACFNQLDVDTRSDIYSLGVLLYELLAGTPAHTSVALRNAGLLESLRVIRETDPPRPSTRLTTDRHLPSIAANRSTEPSKLMAMLRGELDWIVMKSIDKDRNRRYETPSGFADDVRRFLEGQSVQAHPPSALYQFRKYVHRHGRTIAACTAIGLLLFGLVVSSVWSAVRRSSQVAVHSSVLSKAIEDASLSLGSALGAPIGRESEWIAARSASLRLKELLALGNTSESTHARARDFLERFHSADQDRQLAEQIENVVIMSATHTDLESWQKMERDFRDLFKQRDID
ncbi:MAG: serine/threonine-protein kinase, partial [Pirellula sp.]